MANHLLTVEARDVQGLLQAALRHGCRYGGLIKSNTDDAGLLGLLLPCDAFKLTDPRRAETQRAQNLQRQIARACTRLGEGESKRAMKLIGLPPWDRSNLQERRALAYGASADDVKAAETFKKHHQADILLDISIELLYVLDEYFATEEVFAQMELDLPDTAAGF